MKIDAQIRRQQARLAKREDRKTVFPPMKQVVDDMDKIARDLQSSKDVIACICWQQEDRTLSIPFTALAALPKGLELEISVDRTHGNYVFKAIAPPAIDATIAA